MKDIYGFDIEDNEPEFPKSNTPRQIRVTYSITGEMFINDMGDEYVQFKNKEEQDKYDRQRFISWFERSIKTKGLEGFDFNISMKSKDMDEEMWNEVTNTKPKDPNEKQEAPF
jgi:hypothetical protein